MNPLRASLKLKLIQEAGGKAPDCPFCKYRNPGSNSLPASSMHEIFSAMVKGGKYTEGNPMYFLENLVLSCPTCNVEWLNGQDKAFVFAVKMALPGYSPERCLPKLMDYAAALRYPNQVIPATLHTLDGREFKLNFKESTYQETTNGCQESSSAPSA